MLARLSCIPKNIKPVAELYCFSFRTSRAQRARNLLFAGLKRTGRFLAGIKPGSE